MLALTLVDTDRGQRRRRAGADGGSHDPFRTGTRPETGPGGSVGIGPVTDHIAGWVTMTAAHPRHMVGIDFGTLSGRALVVRVEDGAELGTAEHEYAHGVMDASLPATDERLPPDW